MSLEGEVGKDDAEMASSLRRMDSMRSVARIPEERPKSVSLMCPVEETRKFSGLRSR